ncbi:hypothetical protein PAXRUDRAFT_825533 [Paxillus rubicundulus Ve08.2h10]|uniref:Distal membrane-arm assembly complex protein 1-like domain-containing protein n=1 Tax=Paxillus rubicundulus Ve08.2h10 TaxID=930991 RepID=A0A0D0EAT8_9AGAM|nr:hypothetical protein PAXRUDRAFT_825533 [Paxillus rubicundulus Ve08.2h10]
MSSPSSPVLAPEDVKLREYKDCISCRVVGTGALGLTGLYAFRMARPRAPGSVFGKVMMAGIGVGFLAGSVVRWNMTPTEMLETLSKQSPSAQS